MKKDRVYWADVVAEAIAQMVRNGEAEAKSVRIGGKVRRIYKIKPYTKDD